MRLDITYCASCSRNSDSRHNHRNRVLGGDTVDMDENGNVFVNGVLVEEDYVVNREMGVCDIEWPYQVPEGQYFILGDNRSEYSDSRSSEVGCIEKKQILGEVVGRIWPLT